MKTIVVYDSAYGNTKTIAESIADELSVRAVTVDEIEPEEVASADLLVVGSPTQGGRPTEGTMGFLKGFSPGSLTNRAFATFDTRMDAARQGVFLRFVMKTIGYAAPKIAKLLGAAGGRMIGEPQGFLVADKEGPLIDRERQRARDWARSLV